MGKVFPTHARSSSPLRLLGPFPHTRPPRNPRNPSTESIYLHFPYLIFINFPSRFFPAAQDVFRGRARTRPLAARQRTNYSYDPLVRNTLREYNGSYAISARVADVVARRLGGRTAAVVVVL